MDSVHLKYHYREKPPPPTLQTGPVPIWRLLEARPAERAGAAEGKGAPRPWRGRQALWLPGCSPRRENAHRTQGEAAKTSGCLARTRRVLPTHSDICLQRPALPQRDWTELTNINKRSSPPACARAEVRHRRDGKQKPNKQREPLQKGPVQQVKIPEGNTDYTGRGL